MFKSLTVACLSLLPFASSVVAAGPALSDNQKVEQYAFMDYSQGNAYYVQLRQTIERMNKANAPEHVSSLRTIDLMHTLIRYRNPSMESQTQLVCSDTRKMIDRVDELGDVYLDETLMNIPSIEDDIIKNKYTKLFGEEDAHAMMFSELTPLILGEIILSVDNATETKCPQMRGDWEEFLGLEFLD